MDLMNAGIIDRHQELSARYKNHTHAAMLEPDGCVAVHGVGRFNSLSLAANAITKTHTNGWEFWHIKDGPTMAQMRSNYLS